MDGYHTDEFSDADLGYATTAVISLLRAITLSFPASA